MYTITLQELTHKQLQELNARLQPFGAAASAISVDDNGDNWRVSVTTTDYNTMQVLSAITDTLVQAVSVPYYTIDQLPKDVQDSVCQQAIDANYYWDVWEQDRNKSFKTICEALDLQYSWDSYDNCHVQETSNDYYAAEIQGASRVIAYIVNRWQHFKAPRYVDKSKKPIMYKLVHKDKNTLPKSWQEDYLPTGYCADYCFYEAYTRFLREARRAPQEVTLDNFCYYLGRAFEKEYNNDYEQAHSLEYAKEYLCEDSYYTWEGEDITSLVHKQHVGK